MKQWQELLFQNYLKGSGKRTVDKHTGKNAVSRTWAEVQEFESFGGILKPGIIDISFDDPDISAAVVEIIQEHSWHTVILKNKANGHIHTYWMNPDKIRKGGKDIYTAAGIPADIHDKGTYIPLRVDGEDRFPPISSPVDVLDEVPPAFMPVKSSTGLYGLKEHDGRNQKLFDWILTSQAAGLSKEDIRELYVNTINPHILADAIPADELDVILREDAFRADVIDLDQFHTFNEHGHITGVYDYKIFEYVLQHEHMFMLGDIPYIYQHGVYVPDFYGSYLKTIIKKYIYPEFIKSNVIRRVYELFTQDDTLKATDKMLNRYPHEWINFQNGFYDPVNKVMRPHDPAYYAMNQIPHCFDPGEKPDGEFIENWLDFITPEDDEKEMLLQYIGYCMTPDTSQQKFMILNGSGGTGKSTVIRMIESIVGDENISNVSLLELNQRFTSISLMGKLLNSCADLEISALEDTSTLKKVLGEDRIKGEAKGKDQIFFRNYAKLIFSTNELPIVKAEKTTGFYRRPMILNMDNVPKNKRPDYFKDLNDHIDYLIYAAVKALERMYQAGKITEAKTSTAAVQRLWMDSDTVEAFLNEEIEGRLDTDRVERGKLFNQYYEFCVGSERRPLSKNGFYRSLRVKGITETKVQGTYYFARKSFKQLGGKF